MTRALPPATVIVPTRHAPPILGQTLAHLADQTLPPELYEVIVVTGTEVETAWRRARAAEKDLPFALRVLSAPGPGAARRRNAGAAAARGELLIFLDDDMLAAPGLLAAHVRAHAGDRGRRVVLGYWPPRLWLPRPDRRTSWLEVELRDWWEDTFQAMACRGHRSRYTDLLSGNFSLSSSLFERAGGFNTDLSCREDYELGVRLLNAGAVFALDMAARSDHQDATDLRRSLQRKADEGRADIQVARLHPELGSIMTFAKAGTTLSRASQWLLAAAQYIPMLANFMVRLLVLALGVLERLKLHALWTRVNGALQLHHYWRGVLREAHGWEEVRSLAGSVAPADELAIDLAEGVDAAQRELEQLRPAGVRFTWHGLPLGRIAADAGAEPIGGRHVCAWLAEEGAHASMLARALFATLGSDEAASEKITSSAAVAQHPDLCRLVGSAAIQAAVLVDRLQPASVQEVDLGRGWQALQPLIGTTGRCEVLLRLHDQPMGWLHLAAQGAPRQLGEIVYELLAQADLRQLVEPGAPGAPSRQAQGQAAGQSRGQSEGKTRGDSRGVSVIVCTRNRPENLAGCLAALQQQCCAPGEVIVVDNAPADARTKELAAAWGVRYVREDRPGLDFARNRGAQAATLPLVAYVDDDARPAANWVAVLAAAFAGHPVAAVTGNVAPAELATPAQCLFEWVYGGMGHGFEPWLFRRDLVSTTELLWANLCGVGTNMAFRRDVLLDLGGFDPALDVGGPAGGGGDLELFHRLVATGHSLLYEPAAVVWHIHRREPAGLRRQLFDNGRAFGAYLLTCAAGHTVEGGQVLSFALRNWLYGALLRRVVRPGLMPRAFVLAELEGALLSPLAYRRAVRRIKTMDS